MGVLILYTHLLILTKFLFYGIMDSIKDIKELVHMDNIVPINKETGEIIENGYVIFTTEQLAKYKKKKDPTLLALSPVLLLKLPIFCYSTIIIVTKNVHYSITQFRRNTANLSYKFCNNYFNSKYHKYHSPFIKENVLFARKFLLSIPSSKPVDILNNFN